MCLQSLQQDIEVKVSFKAVGNPLNYLIRADAAHQLMCLLSFLLWVCCSFFCIDCCWMCIILYKSVLIVTFLYFFLFFCTSLSWVDQSSVVIKPSQGAGWWWSILADFFCCSEAIFCFGSELLCRRYKQLVIWMLIFNVDCAGSGGLLLFASQDATIRRTIRRMYFLSC